MWPRLRFGAVKPTMTKSPVRSALILSQLSLRPAAIRRVGLLGDDPLEAERAHLLEERFALALDVVEGADRAELRERRRQQRLSRDERQRPQVEVLECQQIERVERRRQLDRGAPNLEGRRQAAALLQPREARLAVGVEHDDFAVDDALVERQRFHGARDLGKDRRVVVPVPREEQRFAVRLARDQPVSVELELEQPAVARERFVGRARRASPSPTWDRRGRGTAAPSVLDRRAELAARRDAGLHFLDGEPREHGRFDELVARRLHPGVALLDEEPIASRSS